MAELRDGVPLTELGVITRWSLAVRQSEAERADLIAELRADLAWLEKTSTRQTSLREAPVDTDTEVADDTPVAKAPTPLRRLPKPASAAPAKVAPAKAAPSKSAAPSTAQTRTAPAKAAPTKAAATKPAPTKAAPRGRRPASGG